MEKSALVELEAVNKIKMIRTSTQVMMNPLTNVLSSLNTFDPFHNCLLYILGVFNFMDCS